MEELKVVNLHGSCLPFQKLLLKPTSFPYLFFVLRISVRLELFFVCFQTLSLFILYFELFFYSLCNSLYSLLLCFCDSSTLKEIIEENFG
jgi:hypothetical protein